MTRHPDHKNGLLPYQWYPFYLIRQLRDYVTNRVIIKPGSIAFILCTHRPLEKATTTSDIHKYPVVLAHLQPIALSKQMMRSSLEQPAMAGLCQAARPCPPPRRAAETRSHCRDDVYSAQNSTNHARFRRALTHYSSVLCLPRG